MAFSLSYSNLLISLSILILFAAPLNALDRYIAVSPEVLENMCHTTLNSSFCLSTLCSRLPDLHQLAKLTIDTTNSHAMATEKTLKSAILATLDNKMKQGYVACSKDYADAISALRDASRDVVSGHYGDVKNNAQNALEEARRWERQRPVSDRTLRDRNKHSSIIVALANQLQKENSRKRVIRRNISTLVSATPCLIV